MKPSSTISYFKKNLFIKVIAFALGVIFLFSLNGCVRNSIDDNEKPKVGSLFDYATSLKKNLDISLKNMQDSCVSGVVMEIYFEYPYDAMGQKFDSVSPVVKLQTNAQGRLNTLLDIPGYLSEIYVVTNFPGYANPEKIQLTSSTISLTLHPAGYENAALKNAFLKKSVSKSNAPVDPSLAFTPYLLASPPKTWSLGTFNSIGVPKFLITSDVVSTSLKTKINATLPEKVRLPVVHPEYLQDAAKSNIQLEDSCEMWATFITEGASWLNVLGYFYYPTNTPPILVSQIKKNILIFPNASLSGVGGGLSEGNKVKLKYFDETRGVWSDKFPPNTTVSWFLIANGFKSGAVTYGSYSVYSIPEFNDPTSKAQQSVTFFDKVEKKLIIGFEDTRTTPNYKGDEDYNDVVFYVTANPLTAVKTSNLNIIKDPKDADGDGVSDSDDEFPADADKAFSNYSPGNNLWGTLAFEDLWPSQGDYDFNDFVTDYNFVYVTNADNEVVEITANFKARAAGATLHNAFAFQLETPSDNILSVIGSKNLSNRLTLNSNGTEAKQSKAVIPVVDDIITLFGAAMVNTVPNGAKVAEQAIKVTVKLKTPVSLSALGTPPYNPFLIASVDQERGREIHLAGMIPTDLVNKANFGQGEDRTDVAAGKYYVANQNFPWALKFPVSFDYPIEKNRINKAYLKFDDWVQSLGTTFSDWYLEKNSYRNVDFIYQK